MDSLSIVVDEVALEGLDGITIPTLWIRLENRQPAFPLKLDDSTKGFIWRCLVNNTDLKFYKLPQEREDVELFDRFKAIDQDTGIATVEISDERRDIYPVHIIPENKDGIQGSCPFFRERKDITKQICSKSVTPLISLEEALKKYGRKLVIVASQALRFRTLIGTEGDPDLKLGSDSYCVLERVGRARWQGEMQRDLHGGLFNADARKFHYFRKSLVKHDLITMQGYAGRMKSGQMQHSILLLLKRFHVNRRTKYDILMECVSNFLQQSPEQFATVEMLKLYLNLNDGSFKRLLNYMRFAKLIEFCHFPLEDLDPSAGPCNNKNGSKVLVRCVKQLKPYIKKGDAIDEEEEEDEDEEEEDYSGVRRKAVPPVGRIMERDLISQAYDIVLSCGTKGCSRRDIALKMNIGHLESRMVFRKLHRDGVVKEFMEDVGRQRTTKYISHKYVGVSDKLQRFAREQERKMLLCSSAPQVLDAEPAFPKTPETSKVLANKSSKTSSVKKKQNAGRSGKNDAEEQLMCDGSKADVVNEKSVAKSGKARGKSGTKRKTSEEENQTQHDAPIVQSTQAECETPACSGPMISATPDSESVPATDQTPSEKELQSNSTPVSSAPQSDVVNADEKPASSKIVVVDKVFRSQRSHETYRMLKRKNLIIEAVRNFKIIEGIFPLQKVINDEEKQEGFSTRCCKKTILRLVHTLYRDGLLKIYTTTIIQDGTSKKVDMIVHPSIQPNDERVSQLIEQIQFKISSSASAVRLQQKEDKAKEKQKTSEKLGGGDDKDFKPIAVRGLGKTLGFQTKMQRLRMIHTFLWYLIYEHPLRNCLVETNVDNKTPGEPNSSSSDVKLPDSDAQQDLKDTESPDVSKLEEGSDDEEELLNDESKPNHSNMKVYVDEDSWKRFIPPVRIRKDFSSGWAMVGDILLCLPLSIFVQFTQINYLVDGLEEYISDPVKQHYLVRALPAQTKRQLLFKRKYIHSFHENLQRLIYMGLLQFGPVEKFKDKDQVFVYLKRNATIVDTSSCEPHYWLVTEPPPDKPFETRHYAFNSIEDVERYWFDLMCICLNTPLGLIRKTATDEDPPPAIVHDRYVFPHLAHLLKGSFEVCDDGFTPGDGKGAAGLDAEFFAHLKRNWSWTNRLLICKKKPSGSAVTQTKKRLKSLLSRNALMMKLKTGSSNLHLCLTNKQTLMTESVEVGMEPASRIRQTTGGKGQKRKRSKKEVIRVPRKKRKEPKKRSNAHDEADHKALKMMTKQRVQWSVQEDSIIMLCSVASQVLDNKLKKPFIPYCIVRDLLHAELNVSEDKTSVAVGRRKRYILRNPQTNLNYRICLAEVYQDKTLMRQLEDNRPADPEKPEDCAKAFSEYVRLLRQKFSSVTTTQDFLMPDSKQELFSRFKVSAIDDGKLVQCKDTLNCTEDIHAIVLHNLIQSTLAMTNSEMKTSRSFQTFHTYSVYDQELLCRVFLRSRRRRLLNRRRIGRSVELKKNRGLPILPMSYQLSQTYYRRFSWRFPPSLCTDSFIFLRSLITNGRGDERPLTSFYHETENRSQSGEEMLDRNTEPSIKKETRRRASESQTEAADIKTTKEGHDKQTQTEADEKPNINDEKPEGEEASDEQANPECPLKSGSDDAPSSREPTDDQQQSSGSLASSVPTSRASEEPPDVSDMLRFPLNSPGGACVVYLSLMSLGLLSVFVSIPKQIVVVDSNLVDNDVTKSMAALEEEDDDDEEDGGEEGEGKKRLQVTSHQASHTNYLLMQGYCSPGIVKLRNLNTSDNIVVESCFVRLKLRNTPAHHCFHDDNSPSLEFSKFGPSLLPSILTSNVRSPTSSPPAAEECERLFIQEKGYTPQDVEACAQLRRSLDEAGENGLDARDLQRAHIHLQEPQAGRTRSLQQYLKDLQEGLQVVRVGGKSIRWVLMHHADPWLLTVNLKQLSQSHLMSKRRPLRSQHNIPFMRKRCSREMRQKTEEPPAKKPSVDTENAGDRENTDGSPANETKTPNEAEQPTEAAEGGGKPQSLEEQGSVQTCPEEKEKEKMEIEQKQEKRRRSRRSSLDKERDKEAEVVQTGAANEEEHVSFISRPWRFIDGKVNRSVCKGILEGIFFHIMSRPGLTQQALLEHYKDVLQPVTVLDLVQALVELGCVTEQTLTKAPKCSLFARSAPQTESEATSEEADTVFYEPTLTSCLRLCQVLPNEQHWNEFAQ